MERSSDGRSCLQRLSNRSVSSLLLLHNVQLKCPGTDRENVRDFILYVFASQKLISASTAANTPCFRILSDARVTHSKRSTRTLILTNVSDHSQSGGDKHLTSSKETCDLSEKCHTLSRYRYYIAVLLSPYHRFLPLVFILQIWSYRTCYLGKSQTLLIYFLHASTKKLTKIF